VRAVFARGDGDLESMPTPQEQYEIINNAYLHYPEEVKRRLRQEVLVASDHNDLLKCSDCELFWAKPEIKEYKVLILDMYDAGEHNVRTKAFCKTCRSKHRVNSECIY
jgi:hypothetical protein